MPLIHSNDSWSKLREVWLGDVYPTGFYDHLEPEIRDVFYQITEWTKQDLDAIEKKLQEFDITVRRPQYDSINDRLNDRGHLIKPEITPRDYFVTVGNRLFSPHWKKNEKAWAHCFDYYKQDPDSQIVFHNIEITIAGSNTVRVGRDIFIDCVWAIERNYNDRNIEEYFNTSVRPLFPEHRVHYLDNGGHVDACFAVLRPGYLLANRYFEDYDKTFPGWQRLMLSDPTFQNHGNYDPTFSHNGKFWMPAESIKNNNSDSHVAFNNHVIKYALDWVGNYKETFFEVNCLVIDEENVMVLGENETVFRYLESIGITVHSVPFRCRTFWDGGLHCLTLDIRRDGDMKDYFPN